MSTGIRAAAGPPTASRRDVGSPDSRCFLRARPVVCVGWGRSGQGMSRFWGVAGTSGCRLAWPLPTPASGSRSLTPIWPPSTGCGRERCRIWSPARPRCSSKALETGMLTASSRASGGGRVRASGGRGGHPGRRASQPRSPGGRTGHRAVADHLSDGQLLVLRSTVFPGVTRMVERLIARLGTAIDVAFCPERIAEGRAMEELNSLPQIVAARTDQAFERAASLFGHLTDRSSGRARGGRAGQALHQLLPLHQVRGRQPALHDGQRLRPRLRADPAGGDRDYPRAADLPGPASPPGRAC